MSGLFTPTGNIFNAFTILQPRRRVTHIRTHVMYDNTWEHITHLAGDGFVVTKQEAVDDIESKRLDYYTFEDGTAAFLIVERPGFFSSPYVRTKPDCSLLNNLLRLPRF